MVRQSMNQTIRRMMMNPYEVLGIKEGASQEEIKAAYKALVKKYHPDRYQNNPLADLAEEKLQQINEAYDMLTNNAGAGSYSNSYGQGAGSNVNKAKFAEVRKAIDMGNLMGAESMLNSLNDGSAEYYFLRGVLCSRKGWYDEAMSNMQRATQMDPGNYEYQRYFQGMMNQGFGYRNQAAGRGYSTADDDCCRMLQCAICFDCINPCC